MSSRPNGHSLRARARPAAAAGPGPGGCHGPAATGGRPRRRATPIFLARSCPTNWLREPITQVGNLRSGSYGK
eukprot:375515-Hanusia_phi.AAC.2